ncbi:TPA: hypothetical protein ACUI22_002345 [Staphylococcus aureus]
MQELQTIKKAIILFTAVTVLEQLLIKKTIHGLKISSDKKGNSTIKIS